MTKRTVQRSSSGSERSEHGTPVSDVRDIDVSLIAAMSSDTGTNATPDNEADELAATEEWLDNLDPDEVEVVDPVELRRVGLAKRGIEYAEEELRDAVKSAREAGQSWAAIGRTLGISRQAAHERFGGDSDRPDSETLFLQIKQAQAGGHVESTIESSLSNWLRLHLPAPGHGDPRSDMTIFARNEAFVIYLEYKDTHLAGHAPDKLGAAVDKVSERLARALHIKT